MSCPDPKCRENILLCLNKKVNKTVLISVMSTILFVGGSFILYAMASDKKQNEVIGKNKENIAIIKTDLKHITKTQDEIKKAVKRIEEKQITKEDMKDIIKEVRKGAGN